MGLLLTGLALTLLIALVLVLVVRFALVVVTVECHSMAPTLESGDRVLVWRAWPARWLRKGQIVIVWPEPIGSREPAPFGVAAPYIKRIAALPGETLTTSITDLPESIRDDYQAQYDRDGLRQWRIPHNHVFVIGDHSLAAADSRIWGPLPRRAILGLVLMTLPRRAAPLEPEIATWP